MAGLCNSEGLGPEQFRAWGQDGEFYDRARRLRAGWAGDETVPGADAPIHILKKRRRGPKQGNRAPAEVRDGGGAGHAEHQLPDVSALLLSARALRTEALSINFLMFLRFFYPRALYEAKIKFRIGYPSDFGFGVDTKFQNQYRIWAGRNTEGGFRSEERTSELQTPCS